jgi:hypothetical protein
MFEKYHASHQNLKNLTPNPFPSREGVRENKGFKASLRFGERFGEGLLLVSSFYYGYDLHN